MENKNNVEFVKMSREDYERLVQLAESFAEDPNFIERQVNYVHARQDQLCGIIQGHPFKAGARFNSKHRANKLALYRRMGYADPESAYAILHPWRSLYNCLIED